MSVAGQPPRTPTGTNPSAAVEPAAPRSLSSPPFVSLTMTLPWNGQGADDSGAQTLATYDLLVTGADTAAPRVVAWGGAGTGPTLSAYDNAVAGQIDEQPEPVSTDAPADAAPAATDPSQEG